MHYIFGGAFVILGLYRAWKTKNSFYHSFALVPKIINGSIVSLLWILLGVFLALERNLNSITEFCLICSILILFITLILTKHLIRRMSDRGISSTRFYVKVVARDAISSAKSKARELYRVIAPDGWRELSFSIHGIERAFSFGVMIKLYFLVILLGLIWLFDF